MYVVDSHHHHHCRRGCRHLHFWCFTSTFPCHHELAGFPDVGMDWMLFLMQSNGLWLDALRFELNALLCQMPVANPSSQLLGHAET